MKLHKLTIQNFRPIKDIALDFEDKLGHVRPITVLAGPNGIGKTSVLFAIVQALRGPMGYRTEDVPAPDDEDIHHVGGTSGLVSKPLTMTARLELEFEEVEQRAIPQIFEATRDIRPQNEKLPAIPSDGRVTVTWKYPPDLDQDGSPSPTWHVRCEPWGTLPWFRGRRHAISGWRMRKLKDVSLLDNVGGLLLFPQDRSLRARVVGLNGVSHTREDVAILARETREEQELPEIEDESSVPSLALTARTSQRRSLWDILAYLGQYAAQREQELPNELNWEKRVQENFKRICAPREYLGFRYPVNSPIGAPWLKQADYAYPLDKAASGEQVILDYVTRLVYPSPTNHGLVLIDEPELHLHPGWVRQLYTALPQIGTGNQYILTTHSAELRQMAAEDNALFDLGELNGGK